MKPVSFKSGKHTLRGFVHEPKQYDTAIVFLHGFPGHCEGKTAKSILPHLKEFLLLKFDFAGTDLSDGKFEDKLISKEVKDVKAAINFVAKTYKPKQIVLFGHSTGAINAALYAYKDKRIKKIILAGGTGDLKRGVQYEFTPVQVKSLWEKGYFTYRRPGDWMHNKRVKKRYYDEFFKLDVLKSLRKFKGKTLVIHAENDEYVPKINADELAQACRTKVITIKNADHQFRRTGKATAKRIVTFILCENPGL
ncbi:MAG: alpha/beta hydrolase [Candidatus Woesearchaeota archaeon]|nr:alpha/beta hydrolase [Candidatus Woesearchaeota archaeon]